MKRNERFLDAFTKRLNRISGLELDNARKQARAEALEEAAKVSSSHAEGNQRLCADQAHDDRYCGTCEAMRDEADILEQKIRALKEKA